MTAELVGLVPALGRWDFAPLGVVSPVRRTVEAVARVRGMAKIVVVAREGETVPPQAELLAVPADEDPSAMEIRQAFRGRLAERGIPSFLAVELPAHLPFVTSGRLEQAAQRCRDPKGRGLVALGWRADYGTPSPGSAIVPGVWSASGAWAWRSAHAAWPLVADWIDVGWLGAFDVRDPAARSAAQELVAAGHL